MFNYVEGELLESLAAEFQYSVKHGMAQNAKACLFNIRIHLDGLMQRYSKVIPEPEMTHLLESACIAYGEQRPDTPFVDTLIRHFEGYARSKGLRLERDQDAIHLNEIQAVAYRGNGVGSFERRYHTSQPENISVRYLNGKVHIRGNTQRDNALSDDPDSTRRDNALSGTQDGTQGNSALMDGRSVSEALGDPEGQPDDDDMDYLDGQTDDEISALIDSILGF